MCLAFWETLKNRNQMEDFSFTVHPFCFEFEEFPFKKKKKRGGASAWNPVMPLTLQPSREVSTDGQYS